MIWVPTALAIPSQRRSTRCMMLQCSTHTWLTMVIWAPKNISEDQVQGTSGYDKKRGTSCSMKPYIYCMACAIKYNQCFSYIDSVAMVHCYCCKTSLSGRKQKLNVDRINSVNLEVNFPQKAVDVKETLTML